MNELKIIEFLKIGEMGTGYISIAELTGLIPFEVKRVFWTYFTPESVVRGRHAHYETQMVIVAVAGRIVATVEMKGKLESFVLDSPTRGLYLPPKSWHTLQYSHNAVQLVLSSTAYDEKDYIRDYETFLKLEKADNIP